MTAQHTPGPWLWEEGTPLIRRGWNGGMHTIAAVDWRLLTWHEDANCAGRESGANASLIAAAPDLLAALQLLVAGIENSVSPTYIPLQKARAAIAKATEGES